MTILRAPPGALLQMTSQLARGGQLTQVNTKYRREPTDDGDRDLTTRGGTIYRVVK